jgi:putative acetyltransferase
MPEITRTDSGNKDFRELVKLLDRELETRDGGEHVFYAQYNTLDKIKHAVVCYHEGKPVGCGAFKEYDKKTVEIKRMFVKTAFRGRGLAVHILKELEKWAAELDYTHGLLETGLKQPEAIKLYQKSGYVQIPNYGQYQGVKNSVCMMKQIP